MDSAPKKHNSISKTSHLTTQTNPDAFRSSKSFYYLTNNFSRLNLYENKPRSSQKQIINPPSVDIHLQAKTMTVSADSDTSQFLLNRLSKQPQKTAAPRNGKESRTTKETSKEKLKKSAKGGLANSKKKEIHGGQLDSKKFLFVKDKDAKEQQHERLEFKRVSVSLGRRRSFCGTQLELADVLASCGVKIVSVDMPPFMQIHAVDCARKTCDSLEKFTAKTLALTVKKEFDRVYGPAWHCIVGTRFGSFVTHSVGGFLYFSMDQKMYILLFKTTVQRAD